MKSFNVIDSLLNITHSTGHKLFFALSLCRDLNERAGSPGRYRVAESGEG